MSADLLVSTVEDKDEVTVSCMVPRKGRPHVELIHSGACSNVSKVTILCHMELTVQNKRTGTMFGQITPMLVCIRQCLQGN